MSKSGYFKLTLNVFINTEDIEETIKQLMERLATHECVESCSAEPLLNTEAITTQITDFGVF